MLQREEEETTMSTSRGFRAHQNDDRIESRLENFDPGQPQPGEVIIRCAWSGINYKDALAATGKGRIMKRFPLVVGIDAAGVIEQSRDDRFKEGDAVVIIGCGIGEESDGGYGGPVFFPACHDRYPSPLRSASPGHRFPVTNCASF